MTDAMIPAFLIAYLSCVLLFVFAIDRLWCRAPRGPWREGFKETCCSGACCCHTTLPVVRPEEVEACQCEGDTGSMSYDVVDLMRDQWVQFKLSWDLTTQEPWADHAPSRRG